jgi:hypothetical protein
MERKFYTDEFEDLIKESADDFKMIPSKKVWQGLYNDLHPGRRWPSLVVTFALLFGLLTISYLNTQQYGQHDSNVINLNKSNPNSSNDNSFISNPATLPITKVTQHNISLSRQANPPINSSATSVVAVTSNTSFKNLSYYDFEDILETGGTELTPISSARSIENTGTTDDINLSNLTSKTNSNRSNSEVAQYISSPEYFLNQINNLPAALLNNDKPLSPSSADIKLASVSAEQQVDATNLSKNPKIKKIRTSKVRWMYSISPNVSYRKYTAFEAPNANTILAGLTNAVPTYDVNRKSSQHPSSGLEAGITLKYPLNKYFRFTAGFQVNYSSYIIEANTIHSTTANILLQNERTGMPYAFSNISYYGNGAGVAPANLRNYTVNISLPVGLEYLIGGNEKVKYYVAATAQPVLALATKSYILSTDNKNFLTNRQMARHINMATNFGAFMSVNSKKLNWQLGPQVNYQMLSSFTDIYPVKEHYINYGIKLAFGRR